MKEETPPCPRCGAAREDWDTGRHDCKELESCDYDDCRAKKNPHSFDEYKEAYIHWKRHPYLAGCSHGR